MIDRLSEERKREIEEAVGRPIRLVTYEWTGEKFIVRGVGFEEDH